MYYSKRGLLLIVKVSDFAIQTMLNHIRQKNLYIEIESFARAAYLPNLKLPHISVISTSFG